MKQHLLKFKSINVSFTDTGKGKAVVFLHGFLGSKEVWKPFVDEISKSKRVITIDLLGHGSSDSLSYVHTMEEMAEAVRYILNHLKLRKYFLIGHSLGGYVCLALAESEPDNVRGLVMFHSTAKGDSMSKQKDRDRAIKVVKHNAAIFINEAVPNLFNLEYKPFKRGIETTKEQALKTTKQGLVAALEGMKVRLDREIVLKFAPYPVFFIVGKKDNILPYKDLITQAKLPECGSHLLLNNVGHMGFIEAKEETIRVVKQFVRKN